MEFHAGERVVVNPLRIKNWIISELEASSYSFSAACPGIGTDHRRAGRQREAQRLRRVEATNALKTEAIAMKEIS